ncbi:hypothetical protein RHSIM_Rhsim11G0196900 [Rhododendron simsii]|uniref:EF-hand domain-containing protein n=1 Tax=Rhododendron simsii TaxID=118357 RepID=A0A834G843_RHOSS|nr:hypothetical protein RHSIM_Rhsim11G0196900 [Rhododendron simsii]
MENTATLRQWFDRVDSDKTGSITAAQLKNAFSVGNLEFSISIVQQMIRMYDFDSNGTMSFEEFVALNKFLLKVQQAFSDLERGRGYLVPDDVYEGLVKIGFSLDSPAFYTVCEAGFTYSVVFYSPFVEDSGCSGYQWGKPYGNPIKMPYVGIASNKTWFIFGYAISSGILDDSNISHLSIFPCSLYRVSIKRRMEDSGLMISYLFVFSCNLRGISLSRSIQASKAESLLISINLYSAMEQCPHENQEQSNAEHRDAQEQSNPDHHNAQEQSSRDHRFKFSL